MLLLFIKVKNNATYMEKHFIMIKNKKRDLNYTKKLEIIVILLENLEELLIAFVRYKELQETPVKIHNGSKYNYHLIIKKLAEEFRGEDFQCLGENTEKYISFSVPI